MIISSNYATNQYQQNFGAGLKINDSTGKLSVETIKYLEERFPKMTETLDGVLAVDVADIGKMSGFRYRGDVGTSLLEARVNPVEPKEQILQKFIGIASGVLAKIDNHTKRKPIMSEISRLKVELETANMRESALWEDERYLKMQKLQKELEKLSEEDRISKDKLVKIFGFKNIDLNGIFTLFN